MKDATIRCLKTLACLPVYPARITTGKVLRKLEDEGFSISRRTLQRDLEYLSGAFPITSEEQGRSLTWFWIRDAALFSIPSMDAYTALTFLLAEAHMKDLFPAGIRPMLDPYFDAARDVLKKERPLGNWKEKVGFVSRTQPLKPAVVHPQVARVVGEALLRDQRLQVRYRARGEARGRKQELNPLALVHGNGVSYLVCTFWDYQDVCHLPLHRFSSAERLETPVARPAGFSLEKYLREERALEYPLGGKLRLDALFAAGVALHLRETPLSADQQWRERSDGWVRVTATVRDTAQLRWWLLGFGDSVRVIGPRSLREEFSGIARRMHRLYRKRRV